MKSVIGCSLAIILGLSVSGCFPRPSMCSKGELRFESPTFGIGMKYQTPGQIYNDGKGLAANIGTFLLTSGSTYFGYGEVVQPPSNFLFGTNQVLRLNNAVLTFDLRQLTQKVTFKYLEQGGMINLGAQGRSKMYIGSMYTMPSSMVINGVTIMKRQVQDVVNPQGIKVAERGVITLTFNQDIGSLIIGGQEISLDDFCFR